MDVRRDTTFEGLEHEWVISSSQYLKECLSGSHLCAAMNILGIRDRNNEIRLFKDDQQVNSFLNTVQHHDRDRYKIDLRSLKNKIDPGSVMGLSSSDLLKYYAFLKFSVESSKIKTTQFLMKDIAVDLGSATQVDDVQKHVRGVNEKYLRDFLLRNDAAKRTLKEFQTLLDQQIFISGNQITVAGKNRGVVSALAEDLYSYIDEAQAGECSYHEASCKIIQTLILATCQEKPTFRPIEHQKIYVQLSADLHQTFNVNVDKSIKAILNYIDNKKHVGEWSFFNLPVSGVQKIKNILTNDPLASKQDRLKKALVVTDNLAKGLEICTAFTEHFYKDMPTLLVIDHPAHQHVNLARHNARPGCHHN